ncbi:MAG: BspA family leucine-rich repeat surface protein [Lachnospiraceae bacterium]|nr:BspA family leucine-rich repeat surface protein [Lachnospiraceae bacterium]MCM1240848.1 BspA family leucine-rich repeat surface protein [Lachnospiraceae bacterium]
MVRNFWKRGVRMAMAGALAMAVFLTAPALPVGATEAGSGISVSGNEAEMAEVPEMRSGEAASSGTIGNPDENENVLGWSYDEDTQTLTITGTGKLDGLYGRDLRSGPLASMEIKKVRFENCKVIGSMNDVFACISRVEQIDFSGLDTSEVTSMSHMFDGCSNLESLDVSNFDTSNVTDMDYMFYRCSSLASLDVSNFDTSNVTGMRYMFGGCSSLASLDVSNFDTSNVTDMGAMFLGCDSLASLDVSNFNTSNVTDMGYMFNGCDSLASLDVSNFDTSDVTDMEGMFSACSSLASLDVSNFGTSNVTDMGGMFGACSSLASLDVSNFDTSNVTDMKEMFIGCSSLAGLDVSNFDTSNVTDMREMFRNCRSLGNLDVSNFDTSNVTRMDSMFNGCSSLVSLDLSNFDTSNVTEMNGMFNSCSSLVSLDLSNFDTNNVTNMNRMFSDCRTLSTLHTPYNIKLSVSLPRISNATWHLPDGTEVTELPQNLSTSVLITRTPIIITTTEAMNMPDVIRVKYVPYSYTVKTDNTDPDNQVTFSVVEGKLAEGLQMYPATGEIYGVPLEAGEFIVTVQASYSNPKYPASRAELKLIVLDNTDSNVDAATDSGYEITQPVPDVNASVLSGAGTQLLISEGEYAEFQDAVYLDGRRLQSGTEYTSGAGSTRITIRNQTLVNAGAGSHTLSLEFRAQDGSLRRAAQNLVISEAGDTGSSGTTENNGSGNDTGSSGTTEDNGSGDNADDNVDDGQNEASAYSTVTVIDYIVQPGDTLWRISGKFFGDGHYWRQIYADNMDVIRNPDRIRVGQHLKIYLTAGNNAAVRAITVPAMAASGIGGSYVVQPGDNLWSISGKVYGKNTRWREIYEANRNILSNPERIYTKQVLLIP